MKNILFALMMFVIATPVLAIDNKTSLTASKLLSDGYKKMTSAEIEQQLLGKTLIVLDLQAGSQYQAKFLKHGQRQLEKIKEAHPKSLTDSEYHGRAPALTGAATFSLRDGKIISSDGIRTYISILYQKNNNILGVRDIDNGQVTFQIKIKSR